MMSCESDVGRAACSARRSRFLQHASRLLKRVASPSQDGNGSPNFPGEDRLASSDDDIPSQHSVGPPVTSNTAAQLQILWEELCDILGSPATAAVIRRAAGRAEQRAPQLKELKIEREQFHYRYSVPASWSVNSVSAADAFRELTRELRPLLLELTGGVVLHRLKEMSGLRDSGLFPPEDQ